VAGLDGLARYNLKLGDTAYPVNYLKAPLISMFRHEVAKGPLPSARSKTLIHPQGRHRRETAPTGSTTRPRAGMRKMPQSWTG
jgi:hypothetical protein